MKKIGIVVASLTLPLGAGAASISNIWDIFGFIKSILDTALPLIIAAAVVYFIYGIAKYVMSGDEDAKSLAKYKIIYGIIGLFVMVSVWGLVNILVNTFNLNNSNTGNNISNQLPNVNINN